MPAGLVPPLPQHLASRVLPVGEGLPFGEAPVPEGLAVREVPPVHELPEEVASFLKSFSLSDTTVQVQE